MSNADQTLDTFTPGEDSRFILLWGRPGSGKTVFAHNWPRSRTLDLDQGISSVAWAIREGVIKDKKLSDIVYRQIAEKSKKGFVKSGEALDQVTETLDEWLEESDEWDTLIIDSLTSLGEFAINESLDQMGTLKMSESRKISNSAGLRVMRKQDWGGAISLINGLIEWLRSEDFAGKTIIMIAHEYVETNEAGSAVGYKPLTIGQLRDRLHVPFGEVYYMSVEGSKTKPKYVMQTQRDGLRDCKTRYGCLEAKMETDYQLWRKTIDDYWGEEKGE